MVQIWPGQTVTCLHTISPGHIWTTLYLLCHQRCRNYNIKPIYMRQVPYWGHTHQVSRYEFICHGVFAPVFVHPCLTGLMTLSKLSSSYGECSHRIFIKPYIERHMEGNTHMQLVLRLRDTGAIKPLPLYVFRACTGIILTFCVENSCCDVSECSNVSVRVCVGKEKTRASYIRIYLSG